MGKTSSQILNNKLIFDKEVNFTMIYAFKTRIYPTSKQREYFAKAFGIRRFIWNYALNEYLEDFVNSLTLILKIMAINLL